ncbi:hypothetical protein C5S31_03850 [ANME-1 cluster archaeon GoMg2]|nr:hypothetical protein [ANME-1 cluster archaeon GoMg2]
MAKGKGEIRKKMVLKVEKVLSCIVVFVILMSVVPGTVFAVDSVASWDSGNDIILPDISNDTRENVSVTSCDVYVAIDDDTCVGYEVYIDGVYQFTEGQGTTPDGFCSFSVTAGTHTLEIRKDGCSATKTYNFLCGVSYTWVSMPDYWCECGGSDCDNPPTANFDKSTYYEGDTVQITVSTSLSSVYYEIKDCSGTVQKTGYTSGGTISYTIPDGSTSSCCYWTICFYWDEGGGPIGPVGAAGNINVESYQCSKCYNFYVCPGSCDAYIVIEDKVCFGYDVYVDGVRQFTEGHGGTPDGYCSFTVSEGYHTIKIQKDGCSEIVFSYQYFQCNGQYKKILQTYWCDCNKPDLIIQDISVDPYSPQKGATVTFTVKIKNQGSGSAGSSTVKYYIDGSYVASDSVPSLSAGSTSTQTFTWTADTCGNVQVKAVADANNAVSESNEGNNYKTKTVSVICDKPDLIVTSIIFNPNPANKDDNVIVSVTVTNQGTGDAGPHYEFLGYPDRYTLLKEWYCSGLNAGASKTFTHTLEDVQHSDTYEACADWGQVVQESNENNNCLTAYLEVKESEQKPDLVIQDISWSPSSPEQGDTITFTVKIKNQGTGSAESSTVKYYIDSSYVASDSVSTLSAGSISTQTFTWSANKCGDVQVKAVTDATNVVSESNEWNNERTETVKVDCVYEVKFRGKVLVNRPIISFYSIDIKIDEIFNDPTGKLKVGDVVTAWSHRDSPAQIEDPVVGDIVKVFGNYFGHDVRAGVESDYIDLETADHYLKQEKKPDFIIQDISWDKSSPKEGDTITFTVKIKNQGDGNAGTSTVKYYIDDFYVASDSVPSLSAGSTSTQTFTWTTNKCGNVQVKAVADATNAVSESNEGNNEKTKTMSVACPRDLKIVDISTSRDFPELGERLLVDVIVENIGTTAIDINTKFNLDVSFVDKVSVPRIHTGDAQRNGEYTFDITKKNDFNTNLAPGDSKKYTFFWDKIPDDFAYQLILANTIRAHLYTDDYTLDQIYEETILMTLNSKSQLRCLAMSIAIKFPLTAPYIAATEKGISATEDFVNLFDALDNNEYNKAAKSFSDLLKMMIEQAIDDPLTELINMIKMILEYGTCFVENVIFLWSCIGHIREWCPDYRATVFASECPVDIIVTNEQGQKIGYSQGQTINEIENADIFVKEDNKYIIIFDDGDFDVELTSTGEGEADIYVGLSNQEGIFEYADIPISQDTKAKININENNPNSVMSIDYDGNGVIDAEKTPNVKKTPGETITIEVESSTKTLYVGNTQQFTATVKNPNGGPMPGIIIEWTSSNTTVGTVSPISTTTGSDGKATTVFTAASTGTITVKAACDDVSGMASVTVQQTSFFDTQQSENPYLSISGTHTGTIKPIQTIEVQKLYTYPCAGTGGHTESVRIYRNDLDESASWIGYAEDWDTLTFDSSFTLEAGKTYNYEIITGSYPQIHHTDNLSTPAGFITCSEFRDVNGKRYSNWIPAIKLT